MKESFMECSARLKRETGVYGLDYLLYAGIFIMLIVAIIGGLISAYFVFTKLI